MIDPVGVSRKLYRPTRVCLMGSTDGGWAMDQDLETIRIAFRDLSGQIEESSMEEADVIHSVWEEPLLRMDAVKLAGKRLIATACNDIPWTLGQPLMCDHVQRIGLWIAISRRAELQLKGFRMPCRYIPYTVNPSQFTADPPIAQSELRKKYGIPEGCYVIGNFMHDTLGADLVSPKPQKGCEVFVGIVGAMAALGSPVHVLLAGPRRHWMRAELDRRGIPWTYVGRILPGDDVPVNIQPPSTMNELYHVSDVCLVTSRWAGGPRVVLEAAATGTRILCSSVGLADDVLEPKSVFQDLDQVVHMMQADIQSGFLKDTIGPQLARIREKHVPSVNTPRFRDIYASLDAIPVFSPEPEQTLGARGTVGGVAWAVRKMTRMMRSHFPAIIRLEKGPRISVLHEFHKPPYGGGNQFMMALCASLRRKGARLVTNRVAPDVDVYICNSAWFNAELLRRAARRCVPRMIHRVDGFISLYRASNRDEDDKIYALNREFATVTLFQSAWSLRVLKDAGYSPRAPMIVRNAVDPFMFHSQGRSPFAEHGKVRLLTTSWSDNPKKGGAFYRWMDEHLDYEKFDYTFVGRTKVPLARAYQIPAQPSGGIASALRSHDIYVTASEHECCSNAVLEALACGVPVLYLDSGAQSELVGFGGLGFRGREDFFDQLNRMVDSYKLFREGIWIEPIDAIAETYLQIAERVSAHG